MLLGPLLRWTCHKRVRLRQSRLPAVHSCKEKPPFFKTDELIKLWVLNNDKAGPLVPGNLRHRACGALFPACPSYLCFFQQVCEDWEPVWNECLQLQGDDGQGQRGAFELPELVAGHTVLHLPGPQHRLEAQRRLLMPRTCGEQTGACCVVPGHACAKLDGRDEVRVARDEQGVELDRGGGRGERWKRDQNLIVMMSLSSHCPPTLYFDGFIDCINVWPTSRPCRLMLHLKPLEPDLCRWNTPAFRPPPCPQWGTCVCPMDASWSRPYRYRTCSAILCSRRETVNPTLGPQVWLFSTSVTNLVAMLAHSRQSNGERRSNPVRFQREGQKAKGAPFALPPPPPRPVPDLTAVEVDTFSFCHVANLSHLCFGKCGLYWKATSRVQVPTRSAFQERRHLVVVA